jgi:uncharacterized protein (DUF3820 family)
MNNINLLLVVKGITPTTFAVTFHSNKGTIVHKRLFEDTGSNLVAVQGIFDFLDSKADKYEKVVFNTKNSFASNLFQRVNSGVLYITKEEIESYIEKYNFDVLYTDSPKIDRYKKEVFKDLKRLFPELSAVDPRYPFNVKTGIWTMGMHKGKSVLRTPKNYLKWAAQKDDKNKLNLCDVKRFFLQDAYNGKISLQAIQMLENKFGVLYEGQTTLTRNILFCDQRDVFEVGKHKGQHLAFTPKQYLIWVRDKVEGLTENQLERLNYYIENDRETILEAIANEI